jgi:hypothetical protein
MLYCTWAVGRVPLHEPCMHSCGDMATRRAGGLRITRGQADALVLEGGYVLFLVFRGDNTVPVFKKTFSPLHNRCLLLLSMLVRDGHDGWWDNLYPSLDVVQEIARGGAARGRDGGDHGEEDGHVGHCAHQPRDRPCVPPADGERARHEGRGGDEGEAHRAAHPLLHDGDGAPRDLRVRV